jgi:hypothetical protein
LDEYWDYQFFPDGKQLLLNDANSIFNRLRQKFLIFAADGDDNEMYYFLACHYAYQ